MLPFTLAGFEIQQIVRSETLLTIPARANSPLGICPGCGEASTHVQSYYTRSPQDLPVSGQRVVLVLHVRRFRCLNLQCSRQTFAEPFLEIPRSARQTRRLGTILEALAVMLSGQSGAKLAAQLAIPVSPDTLLRWAKKPAEVASPPPRALGVDDFAFRRGHPYGTLLLDLETHQPVDLLADRTGESLAAWLKQHPGVEIISRDRAKDYQRGATDGAPLAQQVIDRWHLLKNLREALERLLGRTELPDEEQKSSQEPLTPRQKRTSGERERSESSRTRRLALYHQVVELSRAGGTIQGSARHLHISRQTVRKFIQAPGFPEWQKAPTTHSTIDPYRSQLHELWREGVRSIDPLWKAIQESGFTGSRMMVYRWWQLQQEEEGSSGEKPHKTLLTSPKQMAPRRLVWVLLHEPERLNTQERQFLSRLRLVPQLDQAYSFAQHFVHMGKERTPHHLDTWLLQCLTSDIGELVTFAQGLEKEGSALRNALALPYRNGPVEGTINTLKYIKRSMYGRSGFPLLRQQVLKAAEERARKVRKSQNS